MNRTVFIAIHIPKPLFSRLSGIKKDTNRYHESVRFSSNDRDERQSLNMPFILQGYGYKNER